MSDRTARRQARKPDPDDLCTFQRFTGTLACAGDAMPIRFKARIGRDGEVELDIHAFRLSRRTWWVKDRFNERNADHQFRLTGTTADGLTFETDSLSFTSLGARYSGTSNWHRLKPRGECGKVTFRKSLDKPADGLALKLHLKGFECFPQLRANSPLGRIVVAGATDLGDADRLSGFVLLRPEEQPQGPAAWRAEAELMLEHLRRILSFAASTMLQAPLLESWAGMFYEAEILSQSRQHAPVMRVVHKLDQQRLLDAAVTSWVDPPIEAHNLFFAIEWFSMATTYNEVRLVNAMTALENLIDSNLGDSEKHIEASRAADRTRRALRNVVVRCLAQWSPDEAESVAAELTPKLRDLNRRSLRDKLYRLAARWQVPLDGISDEHIRGVIAQRNAIVHSGQHRPSATGPDLWHHMTIVRELVVRFLLSAIRYRGGYISHVGGYHLAEFPPGDASTTTTEGQNERPVLRNPERRVQKPRWRRNSFSSLARSLD